MGTRSLTTFIDNDTKEEIVVMYRQFDGYPSGHGRDLINFLDGIKVVNGIPGGKKGRSTWFSTWYSTRWLHRPPGGKPVFHLVFHPVFPLSTRWNTR